MASLLDFLQSIGMNQADAAPPLFGDGTPAPSVGTGAPMGFGSAVIPQAPVAAPTPAPAAATAAPIQAAAQPPDIQIAQAQGQPDVTVPDNPAPDTQTTTGLLGALIPAAQQASADPGASKGLLSSIGDTLSNLSPAASQGLLATGLGILANNDGQHNLSQLVGLGGMSGLNAYSSVKQNQAANQLAYQKLAYEQNKPVNVAQGDSLVNPLSGKTVFQGNTGIVSTREFAGPNGQTLQQGIDRFGNPVGPQTVKADPASVPAMLTPDQRAQAQQKSQDAQVATQTQLGQIDNLSGLFSADNEPKLHSGVASTASRAWNNATGGTDFNSQARQQLDQYRTTFINQSLPPGSASDADIRNAAATVPDSNASPAAIRTWLAVARKAQEKIGAYNQANSDFTQASAGGTTTRQPIQAPDGSTIPAGTDFQTFMKARGIGSQPQQAQQQPSPTQAQAINQQAFSQLPASSQQVVQAALASGNPDAIAKLRAKGYIR